MGAANEVTIVVKSKDETAAAFASATKRAHGFRDGMKSVGSTAGGFLAAGFASAAGAGLISFFKGAIDESREAFKVNAATTQGIKSMGAESWITADAVAGLSQRISEKIGVDDELIQKSANLLLTFGKVRNEADKGNMVFDRAVQLSQDLAARGFGDAESSAKMLGKALNDPIKGITSLGRAGVTFTEEQKKTIKSLVETGQVGKAQALILDEVARQVGGSAEAMADPWDKMSVTFKNFQEEIGNALLPIVEELLPKLIDAVKWVSANKDWLLPLIGGILALKLALKGLELAKGVGSVVSGALDLIGGSADRNKEKVGGLGGKLGGLAGATAGIFAVAAAFDYLDQKMTDGAAFDMFDDWNWDSIKNPINDIGVEWNQMWANMENDGTTSTKNVATQVNALKASIDNAHGTVTINGNHMPADQALAFIQAAIDRGEGTVTINGNQYPAELARQMILGATNRTIGTMQIRANASAAEATLAWVARERIAWIRVATSGAALNAFSAHGNAHGGIIGAAQFGGVKRGLTMVGEQGPELVRLPTGSHVTGAGQTKAAMESAGSGALSGPSGGGGATVTFRGATDSAFASYVMKLIRSGDIQISSS